MRSGMATSPGLSSAPKPTPLPLNIAIFAGEYSGDIQGAALAAALRDRCAAGEVEAAADAERGISHSPAHTARRLSLWGIGGASMRDAGVQLRFDSTHWGAMGTYEALKLAPRLLSVL